MYPSEFFDLANATPDYHFKYWLSKDWNFYKINEEQKDPRYITVSSLLHEDDLETKGRFLMTANDMLNMTPLKSTYEITIAKWILND